MVVGRFQAKEKLTSVGPSEGDQHRGIGRRSAADRHVAGADDRFERRLYGGGGRVPGEGAVVPGGMIES